MKTAYYLHFLLLVSLCVGQIASYTHIVGHFDVPTSQSDHTDQHTHEHHQHLSLIDLRQHTASNPDKKSAAADCSIYHIYAGQSAIGSPNSGNIVTRICGVQALTVTSVIITTQSSDSHPIRGPPLIS